MKEAGSARILDAVCWGLFGLWLASLIAIKLAHPAANGGTADQPALTLMLALCCAHGLATLGARDTIAFVVLSVVLSWGLEATSIATGFPFGFYVHNVAGANLMGVPPAVPATYYFLTYIGWSLACVILRCEGQAGTRIRLIGVPLLAALIIPGYDIAVDPIGSTTFHAWSYRYPSGYLGVPLTNFLGWIFTSWIIAQAFALWQAVMARRVAAPFVRMDLWLIPGTVWGLLGLQYWLDLPGATDATTTVAGRTFIIRDIFEASVVTGLLAMLLPAVAGVVAALSAEKRS